MLNWFGQLTLSILLFVERLLSKETYAEDADPTAGGIRDRLRERVRNYRGVCPSGDSCTTGGTCAGSCLRRAEGRDSGQVDQ